LKWETRFFLGIHLIFKNICLVKETMMQRWEIPIKDGKQKYRDGKPLILPKNDWRKRVNRCNFGCLEFSKKEIERKNLHYERALTIVGFQERVYLKRFR
jgi:hypothetical protein